MADVAGRAGVSVMTVSRVLNGFPGVAEATRQRVEEAVAALGYRANPAARVLAGGRSRTLGVIAVETQQFGPSHMLYGIEAAARGAGHVLSFVTMAPGADEIDATLDHLRAAHVEGVIVIAPVRPVIDAVVDLDADLPLVVVGGDPSVRTSTVTIDQEAGARMATGHLLGLGHRTVHHVSGPADWIDATERQRAWAETLQAHGAPPGRFVEGDWTAQGGYAAGTQLAQDPTVTAVFAANDQTALGDPAGAPRARPFGARRRERGRLRRHPRGGLPGAAAHDRPPGPRRSGATRGGAPPRHGRRWPGPAPRDGRSRARRAREHRPTPHLNPPHPSFWFSG